MLWIELLNTRKSLQIKASEESLVNSINIDAPQVTVLVDFCLKLENQVIQNIEAVRNLVVLGKTVIRVSEQHDQEIVSIVKSLNILSFFLIYCRGNVPKHINLDIDWILFTETKCVFHLHIYLSLYALVLEFG
jgi:hypothetical protein